MTINFFKSVFQKSKLLVDCGSKKYNLEKKINKTTFLIAILLLLNILMMPLNAQIQPDNNSEDLQRETSPSQSSSDKPKKSDRINYVGIGGAIGLEDAGETALGEGGFSILGRFSLTDHFSIHSSSIISGDNLISIAATGGVPIKNKETGRTIVFPFVGAGISADTEDFNIDPVVTGGVDVPINQLITGTARVNANFGDETDIGILLGVGID